MSIGFVIFQSVHFATCNRAKVFSKRVRCCRAPDPESDMPASTKFGEEVVVDHMVVSKSSGGEKFLVLIVYDSLSGIINAGPAFSQGSDFAHACLCHFVGLKFKNPDTVCRSDAAPELIKAIYVIWDGCRKPRCLEDGLISQDVSA